MFPTQTFRCRDIIGLVSLAPSFGRPRFIARSLATFFPVRWRNVVSNVVRGRKLGSGLIWSNLSLCPVNKATDPSLTWYPHPTYAPTCVWWVWFGSSYVHTLGTILSHRTQSQKNQFRFFRVTGKRTFILARKEKTPSPIRKYLPFIQIEQQRSKIGIGIITLLAGGGSTIERRKNRESVRDWMGTRNSQRSALEMSAFNLFLNRHHIYSPRKKSWMKSFISVYLRLLSV